MSFLDELSALAASGQPFVSVTVVSTSGSVPAEPGAKMLVTSAGRAWGTVGGGKVEQTAIERAVAMLSSGPSTQLVAWNLNRDLGMKCGGAAQLFFEAWNVGRWTIAIFGAGHVANAVASVLVTLDCRVLCFDNRREWLDRLPPSVSAIEVSALPEGVASLPPDAFVLLMTTGHATDLTVLLELLRGPEFPYVGMIGSETKARRMREALAEAGIDASRIASIVSPIGLSLGSNHPSEIAISVAAQLLERRDRLRG